MGPVGARRPTLRDVAEASGLSRATVSFVLNEDPKQSIPATTARRVREAAEQLGYVPHAVARTLREGSSRVIVLETEGLVEGEPLRDFIRGMRAELEILGHALLIQTTSTGPPDRRVLDVLRPRAVVRPGALLRPGDDDLDGGWQDGLAAHSMVQMHHLTTTGHTAVVFVVPAGGGDLVRLRTRLAVGAAQRLGIRVVEVLEVPTTRGGAVDAVQRLRLRLPMATAFAAFDDRVALQLLGALSDVHCAVPEECAVIGFGDSGLGEFTVPPLTSVRIDAETHGRIEARTALGLPVDGLRPSAAAVVVRRTA